MFGGSLADLKAISENSSRWLRAVFDPLGGQTVTVGKSSSMMGWVVMVVDKRGKGGICQL